MSSPGRINAQEGFVQVKGKGFIIRGNPYHFLGTNFWYGMNLGSRGPGGDRPRLLRELDRLKSMGINNLRIMGGSEGPDSAPWRMVPSLQPSPGIYNQDVLNGLDFLLSEMHKRGMYAVVCLNNFWDWSGGFGQYIVWSGEADKIPYPPPSPGGNWQTYQEFAAGFYSNPKAQALFEQFIHFIIGHINPYTGKTYRDDPTIMAWELANEPRGINNVPAFLKWIDQTAGFIKSLDSHHLVTTGSEGDTPSPSTAGNDFYLDHSSKYIDYTTIHIWVQNWGMYNPADAEHTYGPALKYALNYLSDHEKIARQLGKPLVMEEFGLSRDHNVFTPGSPVTIRDQYYSSLFKAIYERASINKSVVAGCNFWAWAGEGRADKAGDYWKPGNAFIGDPAHEPQGWYSVFDTDTSTIRIIQEFARKMNSIGK